MPTPADALARAARHVDGVVGQAAGGDRAWTPLPELLVPAAFRAVLDRRCARARCDDVAAVGSVLVRDLLVPVTRLAVAAWSDDHVALDVSSANLAVDLGGERPRLAIVEVRGAGAGVAGDEEQVLGRLEAWLLDDTTAVVVDALRQVVRVGARHLWGSVALAVVNTLATLAHCPGSRADDDRATLLARRPDLACLVELVTTDDGGDGSITYAIRRTCCLLLKVPPGTMCGTCSLRPRGERVAACNAHYRAERASTR